LGNPAFLSGGKKQYLQWALLALLR